MGSDIFLNDGYKPIPSNENIGESDDTSTLDVNDDDGITDPRLKYYPIPLVARTVGLDNNNT